MVVCADILKEGENH